jgi:glucose-6-phosphate isomerase
MSTGLPVIDRHECDLAWQAVDLACSATRPFSSAELIDSGGAARLEALTIEAAGLRIDLSRQRLPGMARRALEHLAQVTQLSAMRSAMMAGLAINVSEQRPALHTALRAREGSPTAPLDRALSTRVAETLDRMRGVSDSVRSGAWRGATGRPISDILHIGIGGSQLGPQLACEALQAFSHRRLRIHFLGNIDPEAWARIRPELNAETTLVIVASKSWRTPETARNAQAVRDWLLHGGVSEPMLHRHLLGVTSNREAARQFGIAEPHLFECPDWVGGRYSLWGAIGLPLMIAIGPDAFDRMLEGARQMDEHHLAAPTLCNAPVMLALTSAWNARLFSGASEVVIPYSDRLRRLAAHLQQLQMESNGKSVRADGSGRARNAAMPVIWGEPGTESQHSFFQALHQGPIEHAIELVMVADRTAPADPWQRDRALQANALAQAQAFSLGHADARIERRHPGSRPVTVITLNGLNPETFGALIALYEHKTASLGWLWGINPFDQWGVELGKRLAERFEALLGQAFSSDPDALDLASAASLTALSGDRPTLD